MVEFPTNALKVDHTHWKIVHITLADIDIQDFINERYNAELHYDTKNGFSVRIFMPVCKDKLVSRYKKTYAKAAKEIDDKEAKERKVAKLPVTARKHLGNVEVAHLTTFTKLIDNPHLRIMEVILRFPGMALTTEPFKSEIGDFPHKIARSLILGKEAVVAKGKDKQKIEQITPFVTFKLGILGSESTTRPTTRSENEAARELEAQLGGLGLGGDDEEGVDDDQSMSSTGTEDSE